MIVRSINLKNIRSYLDEKVIFKEGTTLLSGDIGCGKTTVLLAIEFAIFGIMKGVLTGGSLLRNGANSGSVELALVIDSKEVQIKRSLRRTGTSIVQDSGMLVVDGKIFEGTPQELKSRILELLGYPEALLTKSKSLIFRYTVFTPQEEMKHILYEDKDERLDILRKLFNIDRYKRVKENSLSYTSELKKQISFLEGKLDSLPDKKKELNDYLLAGDSLQKELDLRLKQLDNAASVFEAKAQEVKKLELEFERIRALEREFEIKKSELALVLRNKERSTHDLTKLKEEISSSLAALQGFDFSKVNEIIERIQVKKLELKKIEETLNDVLSKKSENTAKKINSEQIIRKITGLDNKCPTCLQVVSSDHIEQVKARENQITHICSMNIQKLEQFQNQFLEKKMLLEKELDNYAKGEREFAVKKVKFEALEEKKRKRDLLEQELDQLNSNAENLRKRVDELAIKLKEVSDKKRAVDDSKREFEVLREKKSSLERGVVEIKTKAQFNLKIVKQMEEDIEKMKQDESKLNKLKSRRAWLEDDFLNLVDTIEKNVLAKIYSEFNSFFQEWFNTLIEDETINVKLDDTFTPVIEQNGYETNLENLSGGEKTSVALAYRLALNKVINDFMSTVKTRDLIILDEPTEGFSTEQLDRVREVLNQSNVLQTIIVSHETKMEGFVDHVIRVRKKNHTSAISTAD